jgi:hypothetical protein
MDQRICLMEHIDVIRIVSEVFRDPYTLNALYISLVLPKLEYTSFVWAPNYDVCTYQKNHREVFENFHKPPGFLGVSELSETLPNFEKY